MAAGWFHPEIGTEEIVIIAEFDPSMGTDCARLTQEIKQRVLAEAGLQVYDVHLVHPGWLVKTTSGKISRIENLNRYLAALADTRAQAV